MKPNEDQILLPFAEREYVDVERVARILRVNRSTVYRLASTRDREGRFYLSLIEYKIGGRKRVLYSSIVRFCDGLRARYHIPDRRPALSHPMFRHKDEDLLPFPWRDTITVEDARKALGYEWPDTVYNLIEEGRFEAYRLIEGLRVPWRISRRSLTEFIASAHNSAPECGSPYHGSIGKLTSNSR